MHKLQPERNQEEKNMGVNGHRKEKDQGEKRRKILKNDTAPSLLPRQPQLGGRDCISVNADSPQTE